MKALLRDLVAGDEAQDLIEYALLASLVSLVSVVALTTLGVQVKEFFETLRLQAFPNRV
jgi:Flp pilus assembly pilin Flp